MNGFPQGFLLMNAVGFKKQNKNIRHDSSVIFHRIELE